MGEVILVPNELKHALFFSENTLRLPKQLSILHEPYFIAELLGKDKPWDYPDRGLACLQAAWKELNPLLESKFERRDRTVSDQMKAAIALFLMSLFWSNSQPVALNNWCEKVKMMVIKPVNVEERLSFVFSRPFSYHAYIQISELIIEQQKQFAKYTILNKKRDG